MHGRARRSLPIQSGFYFPILKLTIRINLLAPEWCLACMSPWPWCLWPCVVSQEHLQVFSCLLDVLTRKILLIWWTSAQVLAPCAYWSIDLTFPLGQNVQVAHISSWKGLYLNNRWFSCIMLQRAWCKCVCGQRVRLLAMMCALAWKGRATLHIPNLNFHSIPKWV